MRAPGRVRAVTVSDWVITASFVVAGAVLLFVAIATGQLKAFSATPADHPVVQYVPLQVSAHLKEEQGSFEIAADASAVVDPQASVSSIVRAARVHSTRASAVHGNLRYPGRPARPTWLVVVEGVPNDAAPDGQPARVAVFGLVDARSGDVLWIQTSPLRR